MCMGDLGFGGDDGFSRGAAIGVWSSGVFCNEVMLQCMVYCGMCILLPCLIGLQYYNLCQIF